MSNNKPTLSELEREAEMKRARARETLMDLKTQLSPEAALSYGADYLRGDGGNRLLSAVRRNPLAAALAVASIGWLLLSARDEDPEPATLRSRPRRNRGGNLRAPDALGALGRPVAGRPGGSPAGRVAGAPSRPAGASGAPGSGGGMHSGSAAGIAGEPTSGGLGGASPGSSFNTAGEPTGGSSGGFNVSGQPLAGSSTNRSGAPGAGGGASSGGSLGGGTSSFGGSGSGTTSGGTVSLAGEPTAGGLGGASSKTSFSTAGEPTGGGSGGTSAAGQPLPGSTTSRSVASGGGLSTGGSGSAAIGNSAAQAPGMMSFSSSQPSEPMNFDNEEREFLQGMRALTINPAGDEVFVGLDRSESAEYHSLSQRIKAGSGTSSEADARRYAELHDRHEAARSKIVSGEAPLH